MIEVAVVNASPLILLARTDAIHLLRALGLRWLVPVAVARELAAKGDDDKAVGTLRATSWLEVVSHVEIPLEIAHWQLGAGESAVLAVAFKERDSVAIVDDRAARRCAGALGVRVIGTAGLVLVARRKGIIPAVAPVLDQLIGAGMYLSPATRAEILRRAGEAP